MTLSCVKRATCSILGIGFGLLLSTTTLQAETCGIDTIFTNGYEVASFVPIAQLSGVVTSPGLTQNITGTGALSVTLTSPATTTNPTVDVTGTFVGPVNTGIRVNGVAGYTAAGNFLVPSVPLVAGANALNVTATILPGATATTSGSITQSGTALPIAVIAAQPIGYAPFAENFTFEIGALPGNATITSLVINFKGTGPNDYSGSLASAPTSYTYQQPGIYTASFQFTDSNHVIYTIQRSVLIQDIAVQRGMLCDVYGYLKDRLTHQDVTGAGYAYQPVVSGDFVSLFTQLGTNMPAAALQLGVIVDGMLGVSFAELLLVRDNVDQTRSGFTLRMTQGTDGVWRISEM